MFPVGVFPGSDKSSNHSRLRNTSGAKTYTYSGSTFDVILVIVVGELSLFLHLNTVKKNSVYCFNSTDTLA